MVDDYLALIERTRKIKNPAIYVHPRDYAKMVDSLGETDDPVLIPHLAGVPVYVSRSCEEGQYRIAPDFNAPQPSPGSAYNLPAFAEARRRYGY